VSLDSEYAFVNYVKNSTTQYVHIHIVTNLINALPGNCSVNMVQHATIEEAVFSIEPADAPIDWLDNDHVICVCTAAPCLFLDYISEQNS
jgi:hypothetical protein